MGARLAGMKIAILVTEGVEQVELTEPREALHREAGITLILSDKKDCVLGMNHIDKSDCFKVDVQFRDANPEDFGVVRRVRSRPRCDARALRVIASATRDKPRPRAAHRQ